MIVVPFFEAKIRIQYPFLLFSAGQASAIMTALAPTEQLPGASTHFFEAKIRIQCPFLKFSASQLAFAIVTALAPTEWSFFEAKFQDPIPIPVVFSQLTCVCNCHSSGAH